MIKTKAIVVVLMVPRSSTENRRGQKADQNTEQRTRDGEPEGNAPTRLFSGWISLHAIFLKRPKTDISQDVNYFRDTLSAVSAVLINEQE